MFRDICIAVDTMETNCPLMTFDARFKRFEGLRVASDEQDWIDLHT